MALTSCWRCARLPSIRGAQFLEPRLTTRRPAILLRPSLLSFTPLRLLPEPQSQIASFSTSVACFKSALVKKKTNNPISNLKTKGSTTLKIKKKTPVKAPRPNEVGARRTERRKLVLANPNALEVPLPPLTPQLAIKKDAIGAMFTFEGQMVDTLKNLGGFQLKQGWEFFFKPSTLVRDESIKLGTLIGWVNGEKMEVKADADIPKGEGKEKEGVKVEVDIPTGGYITIPKKIPEVSIPEKSLFKKFADESRSGRGIIHGLRGSGKSVLLAQAMAWAHQRSWVVITIPNAQDLIIGHTEYEHDTTTNLWLQKHYTMTLLQRFLRANAPILKTTTLSKDHVIGREQIPQKNTLYMLAEIGTLDVALAWDVFNAVLYELSVPGRPPVLFTLDNFNYITLPSSYRDTTHTPIHSHDLALPNLFLSYLNGQRSFWRGVTLAATTTRAPASPALAFALAEEPAPPYKKLDPRIPQSIKDVPILNIRRLTKAQTKVLMEYYRDSGLYQQNVEETLSEKWVLSSGIPKELMAACLRVKY